MIGGFPMSDATATTVRESLEEAVDKACRAREEMNLWKSNAEGTLDSMADQTRDLTQKLEHLPSELNSAKQLLTNVPDTLALQALREKLDRIFHKLANINSTLHDVFDALTEFGDDVTRALN